MINTVCCVVLSCVALRLNDRKQTQGLLYVFVVDNFEHEIEKYKYIESGGAIEYNASCPKKNPNNKIFFNAYFI